MLNTLISFIQDEFKCKGTIPLHAPVFLGRELEYVSDAIKSTFVSSIGTYVNEFEKKIAGYTNSPNAVAVMNGTAALHASLLLCGLQRNELVITQPLSFVATCNAIAYCSAEPVFIDVDRDTLSLSPKSLHHWLEENAYLDQDGFTRLSHDKRIIRACVVMHTFGHPAKVDQLLDICQRWNIKLVEDAAESLGSFYHGKHTGTYGQFGALSFNGNKIITTGGGGMILSDIHYGNRAKHLTTTAKQPHAYEFLHDEIGFNYRLPNLNAALGCAQLERLEYFIQNKRNLAKKYERLLKGSDFEFVTEPEFSRSNYWLNAVICENIDQRDALLKATNSVGIMTRPVWRLLNSLPMYKNCIKGSIKNSEWLEERIVNLPSSAIPEAFL